MSLNAILVYLLLFHQSISNLIINGDFENFTGLYFFNFTDYNTTYFWSNISLWYPKDNISQRIEIKIFPNRYTTNCVELYSDRPITLCQDVELSIGSKYMLQYSVYSSNYTIVNITAFINNNYATELLIQTEYAFANHLYIFDAQSEKNSICFNQTHYPLIDTFYGALIDNISLVLIQWQFIMFNLEINQLKANIFLQGNISFNQYQAIHFQSIYPTIYLEQKLINYIINNSTNGKIQIIIYYNFSFKENTIKFLSNNINLNQTSFEISFISPLRNKYYHSLNSKQSSFLIISRDILIFTNKFLAKLSTVSRIFFASYFISLIVDAHFLSLFYVFIQPQFMPQFAKKIYFDILQIIFSAQSSTQYIQKILNIKKNIFKINIQNNISENIQNQKNQQIWFGSYNFSNKILQSNIANILTLFLLIIKIKLIKLCLKIIRQIVPSTIKKDFKINTKTSVFLLRQFCFMSPILVISTLANIINSSNNFKEKLYKIFSINLMLFMIGCLVWYMSQHEKKYIKNKKNHINCQQNKKIYNKSLSYYSEDVLFIPLLFFIPFGVFFGNVIFFFVINGLINLLRLFGFFKIKTEKVTKFENIINFINILLWITHHFIFLLMWTYKKEQMSWQNLKIVSHLGLISVFTILAIFLFQTVKLIVMTIKIIIRIIKFIQKLYKKQKKYLMQQKLQNTLKIDNDKKQNENKNKSKSKKFIEIVILNKQNITTSKIQKLSQQSKKKVIKQKKPVNIANTFSCNMIEFKNKNKKKEIFTQFDGKPQPSPIKQINKKK